MAKHSPPSLVVSMPEQTDATRSIQSFGELTIFVLYGMGIQWMMGKRRGSGIWNKDRPSASKVNNHKRASNLVRFHIQMLHYDDESVTGKLGAAMRSQVYRGTC